MFIDCLSLRAAFPPAGRMSLAKCNGTAIMARPSSCGWRAWRSLRFPGRPRKLPSPWNSPGSPGKIYFPGGEICRDSEPETPGAPRKPAAIFGTGHHVPEARLFIFAEESVLSIRPSGILRCEPAVAGTFKTRPVPCRESDVLIHLEKPAAARLLAFLPARRVSQAPGVRF